MTAPRKPAGRTLAEFELQGLSLAEQKLLEHCRLGTVADISAERPEAATDDNTVRAAFLRFLALGGDEQAPVHEHGVQLVGAWIEGVLDMEAARILSDLTIKACYFDKSPLFSRARIAGTLDLSDCDLLNFSGDSLVCDGDLLLCRCLSSFLGVRLMNAQIGGNLQCNGAKFDGDGGVALLADHVVIKGSVFLSDGFSATGKVRLQSAQIAGNLVCDGAKFDGKDGDALSADGMIVEGTFFFRNLAPSVNGVFLAASHVGCLADDKDSWGERLVLDGFVYGGIIGVACKAPTDAATRLAWLDKQRPEHAGLNGDGADFRPQPWRQLAKVLREMGHAEDARQVAIAFEHRLRRASLVRYPLIHWLFGIFTGYGYRPMRLLISIVVVWLFCAMFYWYAAAGQGVFAPSNPLVFQNPNYAVCAPGYVVPAPQAENAAPPTVQGAGNWYLCEKLPEEYSGFSPLAYSLDVILPLVDLQQETSWSPLVPTPKAVWYQELFSFCDWKHFTRLVLWFEILFGWVSSLLLVAVVSGLTKRREE